MEDLIHNQQQHRRRRRCVTSSPPESTESSSSEMCCSADKARLSSPLLVRGGHRQHRTSSSRAPLIRHVSFLVVVGLVSLFCPQQFIASVSAQTTYGTPVGGCKSFNLTTTADSTLTIKHFSAYFDTTECLRATVSTYDDFTDMWSTMCQADVRGGGGINITLIPESSCVPHTLLPGETGIFRMEYASCSENCTSACNCGPTMELPLGRLDEHYLYLDQLCDADGTCVEDPIIDVIGLGYPLIGNWNTSFPSASPSEMPSTMPVPTIIGVGTGLNVTEMPSAAPSEPAALVGIGRLLGLNTSFPSLMPSMQPSASPVVI